MFFIFKRRSFISVIVVSALFLSMLGTSYAYSVSTDGSRIDVTHGNLASGVAVVF